MFGILHGDETDPYVVFSDPAHFAAAWKTHKSHDAAARAVSLDPCERCGADAVYWYEIDPADGEILDPDPFDHPACVTAELDERHADMLLA